jgi:hypothetical protein
VRVRLTDFRRRSTSGGREGVDEDASPDGATADSSTDADRSAGGGATDADMTKIRGDGGTERKRADEDGSKGEVGVERASRISRLTELTCSRSHPSPFSMRTPVAKLHIC